MLKFHIIVNDEYDFSDQAVMDAFVLGLRLARPFVRCPPASSRASASKSNGLATARVQLHGWSRSGMCSHSGLGGIPAIPPRRSTKHVKKVSHYRVK